MLNAVRFQNNVELDKKSRDIFTDGISEGVPFLLKKFNRSRVPGEDDGSPMLLSDPRYFDHDPWVNLGQQDFGFGGGGFPYLDDYALTGGVSDKVDNEESFREKTKDELYQSELGRADCCGFSSAVVTDEEDFTDFLHPLDCRKVWCPRCGGRGGRVHRVRKRAFFRRVDLSTCNLRYFVFTVPDLYRDKFRSREGLNQLFSAVNRLVKKYFVGAGALAVVHLYGDKDLSKYHPHINVVIPEPLSKRLKLSVLQLRMIKKSWRRALIGLGCVGCDVVDVYYQYRLSPAHKGHCVKYVMRPSWGAQTLSCISDDDRFFLVIDLKGFQYLRFWGGLANCKYREGGVMNKKEILQDVQAVVGSGRKLRFRGIVQVDIPAMLRAGKIEKVGDNLYRVVKKSNKIGGGVWNEFSVRLRG